MKLEEFDYDLPEELIAQKPVEPRDLSRLMVVHRKTGEIEHRVFRDIVEYLEPGDLLVFNVTRVIPARLFVRKPTGAKIEILLLEKIDARKWKCLVKPGNKVKVGNELLGETFRARCLERAEEGSRILEFDDDVEEIVDREGRTPLPPYIHEEIELERYQTVYAKVEGSVAAPTAGLHFTRELLDKLKTRGVEFAEVVLHVGIGTFRPIKSENVEEHRMHSERYFVDHKNASRIWNARKEGRRIVAVGTTSVRVLETMGIEGEKTEYEGETSLFIHPPFDFKLTDALITNFHLPRSTLLLLVSAFAGRDLVMRAYAEAVKKRYRFFSFGDACFFI
ncbi:MAG TPA: tRNA preQ1(34) S-adenosylmethionine ribosyltransferase-isomerase QueA [Thermotogae bacterium]|nr:tRNA preQ1(34) S-adenosylmethionine ribosyltransferase-isomerase QueA [Thermotogota bacterium]